jgi:sugar phosphate isomerase/epimerase
VKVGIFDKVYQRATPEETFAALAAADFEAVQLHLSTGGIEDFPAAVPDEVARRLRQAAGGVEITAVSGMWNMAHPDAAVRRDGLSRLEAVAGACAALGTGIVGVCTGSRNTASMWRNHPDNRTLDAWADMRETMAAALNIAERHGVVLAMEPEVNNVVDSPARARQLIDELGSPALKVCIDGANIFHAGQLPRMAEVLDEAFQQVGDHVAFAHGKDLDHDGDAGHLAAGHGVLDFDRYVALLRAAGYDGAIILHGLTEEQAPGCRDFLRAKIDLVRD